MLRDSFEDLRAAVWGADLLVTHTMTFAGPIVAACEGIPWASAVLAPASLMSRFDPPVLSQAPWMSRLRPLGPRFHGPVLRHGMALAGRWVPEVDQLRADLGLPPGDNPLGDGQHAPGCVLALFSGVLGVPQADWPPQAVQTGFPFLDAPQPETDPDLERFLDAGDPPVVFTLGSSAVHDAGRFYAESLDAARRVGRRAVLIVGPDPRNRLRGRLPSWAFEAGYADHGSLFPRAWAVVHHGGVGTTAQGLRAGKPMLVVPYTFDQFDNADRVVRLGLAASISSRRYNASRSARGLGRLAEPGCQERAARIGRAVRAEDGVETACRRLDALIASRGAGAPARSANPRWRTWARPGGRD
ncbi:4'-demethylrebeccamycin synthase [Aquisphaera giovannonii]|uniref:4'-demethylrebeccamycin synthase n=1 Tax=Aquisphaera giovannonii TaxID=406548 RepID=A0A5B9VZ08_9BACT|nr:glycosyltransferase [Aquisphaera giovannonii]QEH33201.1 4'-demethylrebeccamycin synthase [Aquisphaera giovannonii]